jgi:hypothetical protein
MKFAAYMAVWFVTLFRIHLVPFGITVLVYLVVCAFCTFLFNFVILCVLIVTFCILIVKNRDFTTNLMHNFLYSTIVSYHVPLHVSRVTALILRRTMYIRSIWFSHALYAGTD